jgi:hypothetical protein
VNGIPEPTNDHERTIAAAIDGKLLASRRHPILLQVCAVETGSPREETACTRYLTGRPERKLSLSPTIAGAKRSGALDSRTTEGAPRMMAGSRQIECQAAAFLGRGLL